MVVIGGLYLVELIRELCDEAYKPRYTIHPSTKIHKDLKRNFWWKNMTMDVSICFSKYLTCQVIKINHKKPSAIL